MERLRLTRVLKSHKNGCIPSGTPSVVDVSSIVRNPISVLNFVEGCMMMGENWVASPSVFNSMTKEKKRVITEDLMYYKCRTLCDGVDYDMSIFDDIRKNIISCMPNGDPQKAIEELKMAQVPVRDIDSMKRQFFSKLHDENFLWYNEGAR